jgi:predicted nucleotidyltransferase
VLVLRDDVIAAVARALRSRELGVEVAVVFGSVARGTAAEASDVDVAVVGEVDVLEVAAELSAALGRDVDVVRVETAPFSLLAAILRDGRIVFEGRSGAAGRYLSRALLTIETDGPTHDRMQKAWLARAAAKGAGG